MVGALGVLLVYLLVIVIFTALLLGAGIGVGLTGLGAASAVGRNPGAATPILVQAILAIAFAEAIVFYALYLLPH